MQVYPYFCEICLKTHIIQVHIDCNSQIQQASTDPEGHPSGETNVKKAPNEEQGDDVE